MEPELSEHADEAWGVLVIRAWGRGAADGLLARVTMNSADSTQATRAVTSRSELHDILDEWITSISGQPST